MSFVAVSQPPAAPWRVGLGAAAAPVPDELVATDLTVADGRVSFRTRYGRHAMVLDDLRSLRRVAAGRPVVADSFDTLPNGPVVADGAGLSEEPHRSPPTALETTGFELSLAEPVRRGLVELWFHDDGRIDPAGDWRLEMFVESRDEPALAVVGGRGETFLTVETAAWLPVPVAAVPRTAGWRRLRLRFDSRTLRLTIDDASAIYGTDRGLPPLRRLRLMSAAGAPPLVLDDVLVSRDWTDGPPPLPALGNARLDSGGILFGSLRTMGGGMTTWSVAGAGVALPESSLDSWTAPAASEAGTRRWKGSLARIRLADGSTLLAEIRDRGEQVEIVHPAVGSFTVPAGEVVARTEAAAEVRQVVRDEPFHFGDRLAPQFVRPAPDGPRLEFAFDWPDAAAEREVTLTFLAQGMEGTGRRAPYAAAIRQGRLASTVRLNGGPPVLLNDAFADRSGAAVWGSVPLRAQDLRRGRNLLAMEVAVDPESGAYDEWELLRADVRQRIGAAEENE